MIRLQHNKRGRPNLKYRLPIYIAALLLSGLFFLTTTQDGFSQESVSLGCCKTVKGTPACVGCGEEGANCAVDGSLCVETDSFTLDEICIESSVAGEAECRPPEGSGCCVDSQDKCTDESFDTCTGQHWFEGSACSTVAMCSPTLPSYYTDKIIIVLAILIVLVLLVLFRRKRPGA